MAFGDAVSVDLGTGTTVGTTASIGVEPYVNWTQHGGFPDFTDTNLEDQDSSATTLDLAGDFTVNQTTRASGSGDLFNMFTRAAGIGSTSSISTLDITEIPYSEYDIILYFCESTSSVSAEDFSFTDGTTKFYYESQGSDNFNSGTLTQVTSTDSGTPDTTGNYVRWTSLTATSTTITMEMIGGTSNRMGAVGMQVIEVTGGGGGRIMSSLASSGGLAHLGGLAGRGGGLAG